jgi:hypothetical protein
MRTPHPGPEWVHASQLRTLSGPSRPMILRRSSPAARSFVQWGASPCLRLRPGIHRRHKKPANPQPSREGRSLAPLDRARPHGCKNEEEQRSSQHQSRRSHSVPAQATRRGLTRGLDVATGPHQAGGEVRLEPMTRSNQPRQVSLAPRAGRAADPAPIGGRRPGPRPPDRHVGTPAREPGGTKPRV